MGTKIDDQTTLHSLLFEDDQMMFAKNEEDMGYMIRKDLKNGV